MAEGGWIKLHRKLRESPIMQSDGLCRLWVHCLFAANRTPKRWLIPGTTTAIDVARGSFITGRHALHQALYGGSHFDGAKKRVQPKPDNVTTQGTPSPMTLWRRLKALEAMGCVKLENMSNRFTLVTVCKYSTYQDKGESDCATGEQPVSSRCATGVQLVSSRCATGEQPVSTTREIQELEEGKEGKKETPARKTIPPKVEDVAAYCASRSNDIDPEHFMAYHEARGWMLGKSKMKDWQATIRTWEGNHKRGAEQKCQVPNADDLKNYRATGGGSGE